MKRLTLLFFALAGLFPASIDASTIFVVEGASAAPGSTGNGLDVLLETTSTLSIDAFGVEVTTTDPDIMFTGATTGTATTYIFSGNSLFGPNIGTTTPPSKTFDASDLAMTKPADVSGTVGLAHFTFNVAADATGGPFTISLTGLGNSLSDSNGNNTPITALDQGSKPPSIAPRVLESSKADAHHLIRLVVGHRDCRNSHKVDRLQWHRVYRIALSSDADRTG
jgi:hypothetical protein